MNVVGSVRQKWRRLSVSKKLYGVVGVMAFLIALELGTLLFAMNTLSALRGFVTGEALWSKAQKGVVSSLYKYAITNDPADYQKFKDNLQVPLGDRKARVEMEKENFNFDVAYSGFVQGRIHPDDIPGIIKLFRRFYSISYIREAARIWREADFLMMDLVNEAERLHLYLKNPASNPGRVTASLARIAEMDVQLTVLEDDFSYTLGEGSRWLERLLMVTLLLAVLTVEATGLLLTFIFSRNLSRSLKELNEVALHVSEGDFDHNAPVRSEDELGQLAENLNQMTGALKQSIGKRVEAENASLVKTMFLANMSHEIRTPLGAILGFTELLRDPQLEPAERNQYIDIIQKTGGNLTKIINDILDISKVEAGRLKIEKNAFSLDELMNEVYSVLNLKCVEKNIKFNFEKQGIISENFYSDAIRLRQILINVVGNAIKFTDAGGSVDVKYFERGTKLFFLVRDTGIGISKNRQGELFQVFSQGDQYMTKRYQGTGLGLALSKKLAQMLGGDIRLSQSEVGKGCTFEISIEVEPTEFFIPETQKKEELLSETSKDGIKGKKILLAEDSPDNQLLVKKLLARWGAHVDVVENGREAVTQASREYYDAILMDMQMPVMDGYSATRILRAKGYLRPIIAFTAHAMKEDKLQCLEAGCDDYLTKPINLPRAISVLSELCSRPPEEPIHSRDSLSFSN